MANCLSNFDLDSMGGKKCKDFSGQVDDNRNVIGPHLLLFIILGTDY